MKTSIDFVNVIDLEKLSRLLSTLTGNMDPTQYFDVGRMIELAYESATQGLALAKLNELIKNTNAQ